MHTRIHFETVSRFDRQNEPSTVGIPLAKGVLKEEQLPRLRLMDGGIACPAQFKVTGCWMDGSVKWLLCHFLCNLPANQPKDLYLELDGPAASPVQEACAQLEDGRLVIRSGALNVSLVKAGEKGVFHAVESQWRTLQADELYGPELTDVNGNAFLPVIDGAWELVENGPVRVLARAKGRHFDHNSRAWFDFAVMITLWAGCPWLQMDYQILNCEKSPDGAKNVLELDNRQAGLKYSLDYPYEELRSMRFSVLPKTQKDKRGHALITTGFNYTVRRGDENQPLSETITADTLVNSASEMFPEVLYSTFMGDWTDGEFAFAANLYQAHQNFPKAIDITPEGVTLHFYPETATPIRIPQGVARTTRMQLFFHDPAMEERVLVDRGLMLEMPPVPVADEAAYRDAGVFPDFLTERFHPAAERFLYRYVDSRAKGLGMLHFGDCPEWEYIKQGRSKGKIIWINNEYDMPHNFVVMLARTGDRRYFDYMKAAVEHWYDVDLCHFSEQPRRKGLLYTHSVDHISGQPVPSHQWVEGFLDYYHLTGNPNGIESAMTIAENLLELMKLPLYQKTQTTEPREIGWAMRTFMAMYQETGDEKWLNACRPIVEVYVRWAQELGTWTTPYPDNFMDRVPFMIHVGVMGLFRYWEVTGEETVKNTLLSVIDDMIENCYVPRLDTFFGKQSPSVRFLNLNGMVLETLAVAYRLTGERSYLEKGKGMYEWIAVENPPPVYDFSKYKEDEFTVIYNCPAGPKRCAQTLLPFLHYYRLALEEGIIS